MFQDELDEYIKVWNHHHIRKTHNEVLNYGRPSLMYEIPESYGSTNCIVHTEKVVIDVCKESPFCKPKGTFPCSQEMFQFCITDMQSRNLSAPHNPEEALDLYLELHPVVHRALS